MKETYWEFSFGFYPGILIGFRTDQEESSVDWDGDPASMKEQNHVFYIPFLDICYKLITLEKIKNDG